MGRSKFHTGVLAAAGVLAVLVAAASPAGAAPASGSRLSTSIVAASSVQVGAVAHVDVRVTNTGSKNTTVPWTVTIGLPRTNTSPTQHVMGTIGALPSGCTLVGTNIACTFTTALSRSSSANTRVIGFDITMPYSTAPLTVSASASAANNIGTAGPASHTFGQTFFTPTAPPAFATVSHCTGRDLTSYYECTLYPTSISSHTVDLLAGGTLDLSSNGASAIGFAGTWSVSGTQLTMTYTDGGVPAGTFVGRGVSANCWEGPMVFAPPSEFNAMYRVCR